MLLTITYEGENTEDLGYLLYKNPNRSQNFSLNFGQAYVFYPEVSNEKTTVALLLDINPIDLARGKLGSKDGGLFDYVNDRPYVSSSFMSTAISRVFGTAMTGRCDQKKELADSKIDLTAILTSLPCQGNKEVISEFFEPLGYEVKVETYVLDEKFPDWGESQYVDLTIRGKVRLCDMLNHIYVLIPVFDRQKHYYVANDETEKLIKHGEGWLSSHPCRNKIIHRYFTMCKSYANETIKRLMEAESENTEIEETEKENQNVTDEKKKSLNQLRIEAVKKALLESGAKTVIDMGCGGGKLTCVLMKEKQFTKISATDVSVNSLEQAKQRLHFERLPDYEKERLNLFQSSLTYHDERFSGYDAACIVEVIEHLDKQRISAFERVVFEFAKPETVIITTPNIEYNENYGIEAGKLRHDDHRFEWTREEFNNWCNDVCQRFNYTVKISGIGEPDEKYGSSTQMGVFTKCR